MHLRCFLFMFFVFSWKYAGSEAHHVMSKNSSKNFWNLITFLSRHTPEHKCSLQSPAQYFEEEPWLLDSKHLRNFFAEKLTFIKAVPKVNYDNGNHQLTKHSFAIRIGCFNHPFKSLKIFIGGCHSCLSSEFAKRLRIYDKIEEKIQASSSPRLTSPT